MALALASALADRGVVPEPLLRLGIRRLLAARLAAERRRDPGSPAARLASWRRRVAAEPIAALPAAANRQHYELPPEFFARILGPRLKYSACLWPEGVVDLAAAEEAMLALSAERAGLADGQRVLDLGCGWGSFALWIAERFPASRVVAVSNSRLQGEWIRAAAARRGFGNVEHRVADVNDLDFPAASFDRIVSIEMLEHVRRHELLLPRLARWLDPNGALFVHVFCHRDLAYLFEDEGPGDWMTRHFFAGGVMPSADLLPALAAPLALAGEWRVSGLHYRRTLAAWRVRLERQGDALLPVLEATYGAEAAVWRRRWRLFLLACEELFGWNDGEEWQVAHYRFVPA